MAKPLIDRPNAGRLSRFSGSERLPEVSSSHSTLVGPQGQPLLKWRFKPLSEIEELPPTSWLVTRYVPSNAFMMIYGMAGSFKSFLALDWAMSIATGRTWLGAKVPQRRVVCYIMGEGLRGLRQRTDAWKRVRGEAGDIYFLERPISLLEPEKVLILRKEVVRLQPAFLVIDTVARNFGAGDENNTRDMNTFVAGCDEVRGAVPDMTLAAVHHTGWNEDNAHRPRGSSVLHAATDLEYICVRRAKTKLLTVKQPRAKDGEEMPDEHFVMVPNGESLIIERVLGDAKTRVKRADGVVADTLREVRKAKVKPSRSRRNQRPVREVVSPGGY